MGYKIVDVIDKVININERILNLLNTSEEEAEPKILIMSKVLKKQLENKLQGYKKIKEDAINKNLEDIDFFVYDKISFLVNEYNKKERKLDKEDMKSFLESMINIEKDERALCLDIKGRLVNSEYGYSRENYETLIKVIEKTDNFISSLESIM